MKKCLFLLFTLMATHAFAGAYKWTDAQGNVHYSDKPPQGVATKTVGGSSARVDDVSALPNVSDSSRDAYRRFLKLDAPRVFLICGDGSALGFRAASEDMLQTGIKKVMAADSSHTCKPYAINDSVVWGHY